MAVRLDLNISLDGVAAPEGGTPEKPFDEDWALLTRHYTATRTFRSRVLHDDSGAGTTGVDDAYARAYFESVGAEIMGAGMFGLKLYGDNPEWRGWWGDEPPFGIPVYVLTHQGPRPPLEFANGTVFHFVEMGYEEALERALADAGDKDVRIGGGVMVALWGARRPRAPGDLASGPGARPEPLGRAARRRGALLGERRAGGERRHPPQPHQGLIHRHPVSKKTTLNW